MEIGAVPHRAFPSMGMAINAYQNGRASLPVAPGMVIYSHFRHVTGTPSPEGTVGVNISTLRILDILIEQVSRMRSEPVVDFGNLERTDEQRVNALIEHYQQQMRATHQAMGVYAPAAPAAGLLFDIAA